MTPADSFPVVPGWETVREIGRGGYGAVYEIRREIGGVTDSAALKHISIPRSVSDVDTLRSEGMTPAEISAEFDRMADEFVKEYLLMKRLIDCSNVVNCFDVRSERRKDGLGWDILIRMELLTPLLSHIESAGMSEEQAIRLGQDLCNALIFCRKHHILHRDIKPGNIMVSDDGLYKLGDFGVARANVETGSGTVRVGTYDYMAPEVYLSEHYGAAADLYSLGIALYWCLNRRRCPFQPLDRTMTNADREDARRRRFRGEPLPPPADGSEAFKRIVLKACAFDPKDRYRSPEELLRALNTLRLEASDHGLDDGSEGTEGETKLLEKDETGTAKDTSVEEDKKKDLLDTTADGSGEKRSSGGSSGGNTVISRTWNISWPDIKDASPDTRAGTDRSSGSAGKGGFISTTWHGRGTPPAAPEERTPTDAPDSGGRASLFSAGSTIYSKTWSEDAPPFPAARPWEEAPAPTAASGDGLKYGAAWSLSRPDISEEAEDAPSSAGDARQGFFQLPPEPQQEPGYQAEAQGAFTKEPEKRLRRKRRAVIIAVSAACLALAAALLLFWRLNAAGSGDAAETAQTSPSPTAQASPSPAVQTSPSPTVQTSPSPEALQWAAPSYTWADDDSSVTATRVCRTDASRTETETAQTTSKVTAEATCTASGKTTFTAVFQNSAFSTQAKTVAGPSALGHDWQAATYTAPRTCARCGATEGEPLQKPTLLPIPDVSGMSNSQMVDALAKAGFIVQISGCVEVSPYDPAEYTSRIGAFELESPGQGSAKHGPLYLIEYTEIYPDSRIRTDLEGAGLYPGESVETNAYLQDLVKEIDNWYYDYYYDFTWSSSDPSVASVDADGTIRAGSPGSATITCTSRDKPVYSKSIPIYVLDP